MAGRKSTKPAAKATEAKKVEAIEPKAEEIKTEVIAEPKETEAEKAPAKRTSARTVKAAKTEETKAAAPKAKKEPAKAAKKELGVALHLQYGGKAYTLEDLVKIAKDVWKYDLKRKVGDLESVELYVKPEENKVYYVMNGESGNFDI